MPTRRCLLPLLVALALALPTRGDESSANTAAAPTSLRELEDLLELQGRRLDRLVELASRDPRLRLVEAYRRYTPADFTVKDRVEAEDLVAWMADDKAPRELREKAFEALGSDEAMRHDPDLVESRGARKPRAYFASNEVTKLLYDRDEKTRTYAHRLLVKWFRDKSTDPIVATYDPVGGSRSDWQRAARYWRGVLRR